MTLIYYIVVCKFQNILFAAFSVQVTIPKNILLCFFAYTHIGDFLNLCIYIIRSTSSTPRSSSDYVFVNLCQTTNAAYGYSLMKL